MGTLVVAVTPQVASELRDPPDEGERSAEATSLLAQVAAFGGDLRAQHPGVDDEALGRWFVLAGVADDDAGRVAEQIRSHPAVEGAYVKPSEELPGRENR